MKYFKQMNLDILNLFSGGVRKGMFDELPSGILSQNGYMGCLAGLEVCLFFK